MKFAITFSNENLIPVEFRNRDDENTKSAILKFISLLFLSLNRLENKLQIYLWFLVDTKVSSKTNLIKISITV